MYFTVGPPLVGAKKKLSPLVNLPLTANLSGKLAGAVTFTRASAQWGTNDAGVLVSVANDVPFFNSKGILIEPTSTNKCTCYSALTESNGTAFGSGTALVKGRKYQIVTRVTLDFTTVGAANNTPGTQFVSTGTSALGAGDTAFEIFNAVGTVATSTSTTAIRGMTLSGDAGATATIVDDTAALTAAGLQNIVPGLRAVSLTTGAGGAGHVGFAGTMTAAVYSSASIYARVISGSAVISDSTGANSVVITGNTYRRFKIEYFMAVVGRTLRITASANSEVRFILPQLEEQPLGTSPMVTEGAAATRAATILKIPTAGNLPVNNFTVYMEANPNVTALSGPNATYRMWSSYVNDANRIGGVWTTGNYLILKRIADVPYQTSAPTVTLNSGTPMKAGFRVSSSTGLATFLNGSSTGSHANTANAVLGTTVEIGSQNNAAQWNGYIKNFRIYNKALPDTQLINLTAV